MVLGNRKICRTFIYIMCIFNIIVWTQFIFGTFGIEIPYSYVIATHSKQHFVEENSTSLISGLVQNGSHEKLRVSRKSPPQVFVESDPLKASNRDRPMALSHDSHSPCPTSFGLPMVCWERQKEYGIITFQYQLNRVVGQVIPVRDLRGQGGLHRRAIFEFKISNGFEADPEGAQGSPERPSHVLQCR